jgi:hypothetical protein
VDAVSIAEVLAANVGREAVVTFQTGNSVATIEGTILAVPEHRRVEREETPDRSSIARGYAPWDPASGGPGVVAPGQIVLMRVARGGGAPRTVTLNKALVQSVEFPGNPTLKTAVEKERQGAKVRVAGKATRLARALTVANPNSQIEWEFALPAGETRELSYQYKVLIRR